VRHAAANPKRDPDGRLTTQERLIAGIVGAALMAAALAVVLVPPDHTVALGQCPNAAAGCVVSVDNDLATLAAVLAGLGGAAALIGLLGVRFNEVQAGGAKFGQVSDTKGLPSPGPQVEPTEAESVPELPHPPVRLKVQMEPGVPLRVDVLQGVGERGTQAPVAVTRLTHPLETMKQDVELLRDYQSARKVSQHSYFLTHTLGPATQPNQEYSVAIRVTRHKGRASQNALEVRSATFYLGKAWGNTFIEGRRGADGRFGIVTEAYGPFLALCEVEFEDRSRILLDHYCDFDMGSLVPRT